MKHGESRFFLNWQMDKKTSSALAASKSDGARSLICKNWFFSTKLASKVEKSKQGIILQFNDLNCYFADKQQFGE